MDAYEKLFLKLETERELSEKEETKQVFNGNTLDEERTLDNVGANVTTLNETEAAKKHFAKTEHKRIQAEKKEAKRELKLQQKEEKASLIKQKKRFVHLTKLKLQKKLFKNGKPEKRANGQLKVFKFTKDPGTGKLKPTIKVKESQLKGHVLAIDYNFEDDSFKAGILEKIKKTGINYIIAPDFAVSIYEQASDMGIHLLKCTNVKSIDPGNNIEVYLEEEMIFDIDNGQEYKFKLMSDFDRIRTVHKMCLGDCLIIGDDLRIKILDIYKDQIKLCVNALKVITVCLHENTPIDDRINIKILKITLDQANLAIEAPDDVNIIRE